jgi:hypothetical protein
VESLVTVYVLIYQAHSNNAALKKSVGEVLFAAKLQSIVAAIVADHAARSIVAEIRSGYWSRLQENKRGRLAGRLKTPIMWAIPEVDQM